MTKEPVWSYLRKVEEANGGWQHTSSQSKPPRLWHTKMIGLVFERKQTTPTLGVSNGLHYHHCSSLSPRRKASCWHGFQPCSSRLVTSRPPHEHHSHMIGFGHQEGLGVVAPLAKECQCPRPSMFFLDRPSGHGRR